MFNNSFQQAPLRVDTFFFFFFFGFLCTDGWERMPMNVSEWTADWYDGTYYRNSSERNPTGSASGQSKVLRGGSWVYEPVWIRSATRGGDPASRRDAAIGFRCAQDRPN